MPNVYGNTWNTPFPGDIDKFFANRQVERVNERPSHSQPQPAAPLLSGLPIERPGNAEGQRSGPETGEVDVNTRLRKSLFKATRAGSLLGARLAVDELRARGRDGVRVEDEHGNNALHHASSRGMIDVVRLLVDHTKHIDRPNRNGYTALSIAAAAGCCEIAEVLLDAGADKNHVGGQGGTPLIIAAEGGRGDVVGLLIDREADFDLQDADGRTPLMAAAYCGDVGIVRGLLAVGADISRRDASGRTALQWAQEAGRQEVVEALQAVSGQEGG